MKLKDFKKNFFLIPENDLKFYGPKDPYTYFNLINEKSEQSSFFSSSPLNAELLRVEPLEYRFISHSFPNERVHDSWKTRIDVKIEKTSTGSVFYVQPKAGFGIWFFSAMTIITLLSGLVQLDFTYKVNGIILSFVLLTIVIYFIERFNVRRLIDRFKKVAL